MASPQVGRSIVRLAIPAIISMVVMAVYNMADTYFVSLVGESDLGVAAISVFMPILLVTQAVSVLFSAGGGAYVSRLIGEKEMDRANAAAGSTVLLSFLSGVVVLVVGLCFARPILLAVGASGATIGMAQDYALIMFLASPLQLTNMAFNGLLRAEGNAVRSMVGTVSGALLNIALDPVFITTLNQGVQGAAVATAVAQGVSFLILGSAYWSRKTTVRVSYRSFHFEKGVVAYILRIGLSTFLIQIFTAVGFAVINVYSKLYGDGTIAAVGIVNRLQYLGFAILFGFSQGFQPVCGYNYGARRYSLLHRTLVVGIAVSMVLGACLTAAFWMSGGSLVAIFSSNKAVIATGTNVLKWFSAGYALTALSLIMLMAYQSMGRAAGALIVAVCRQGVCMIPTIMILAVVWGFFGIMVSPFIADLLSGVISVVLAVHLFRIVRQEQEKARTTAAAS